MNLTVIAIIVILVLFVIATAVLAWLYLKNRTLEDLRGDVYQLFLMAEHKFNQGENAEKFEYVVQLARSLLPRWISIFITESALKKMVQFWFNTVKDVLDDGKYNYSVELVEDEEIMDDDDDTVEE